MKSYTQVKPVSIFSDSEYREHEVSETDTAAAAKSVGGMYQLYLEFVMVLLDVGSDFEVHVGLYNRGTKSYITEDWVVLYSDKLKPLRREGETVSCIFKNIECTELASNEIYLVMRVVRRGGLNPLDEKDRKKAVSYEKAFRRPYGTGYVKLDPRQILQREEESRIEIYSCGEQNFSNLQDMLMEEEGAPRDPEIKLAPKAKGIIVKSRLHMSDFNEFWARNPLMRKSDVVEMVKVPDVVMPGTVRNDVYVTLESGEFSEKNVEVTCYLRRNAPLEPIAGALVSGVPDQQDTFRSMIVVAQQPRWKETFRVRLDDEATLAHSHVYFEFRHCGNDPSKAVKPFGYSFVKLENIQNEYELPVYKAQTKGGESYIEDGAERKEISKSALKISVKVSSTLITQQKSLNDLFAWKDHAGSIKEILKNFTYVAPEETVKHIERVFHTLFEIIERNEDSPDIQQEVYNALVMRIASLTESKSMWDFRPVLDFYILTRFKETTQHEPLLKCLTNAFQDFENPTKVKILTNSMRVLDYVWMFIVQSRLNYDNQNNLSAEKDEMFKRKLLDFLARLRELLTRDNSILIGSQNFAFKHIPTILHEMIKFFKPTELCDNIFEFLAASEKLSSLTKIISAKLGLYATITTSEFFARPEYRCKLIFPMVGFLTRHLTRVNADIRAKYLEKNDEKAATERDLKIVEGSQCIDIFGILIDILQIRAGPEERSKTIMLILPALPQLINYAGLIFKAELDSSVKHNRSVNAAAAAAAAAASASTPSITGNKKQAEANSNEPHLEKEEVNVLTVILGAIHVMTAEDLEHFIVHVLKDDRERIEYTHALLRYLCETIKRTPFPHKWGTMNGFQFTTLLKLAHYIEASPYFRNLAKKFNNKDNNDANDEEDDVPPPPPPPEKEESEGSAKSVATTRKDSSFSTASTSSEKPLMELELEMWDIFFKFCINFTACTALDIENVSLLTLERYRDVRVPMCVIFTRFWKLFDRTYMLFPDVILELLRLMNLDQRAIRRGAIEAYFDVLEGEYAASGGSISAVTGLTVDSFDKVDFREDFASVFFDTLKPMFDASPRLAPLWGEFAGIREYLDLICSYEAIPFDEKDIDVKICAMHNLLRYLKAAGRARSYIKYIHILYETAMQFHDSTAAGFAFQMFADTLDWSDTIVGPIEIEGLCKYEAQPAWMHRETALNMAVCSLDMGQEWEHAVKLTDNILRFHLERHDYTSALKNLADLGDLYNKLAFTERLPPTYYRVALFGTSLPPPVRNKEFIVKARPLEKLIDFQQRIKAQYPGSELLTKTDYPGVEVTTSKDIKLLITAILPSSNEELGLPKSETATVFDNVKISIVDSKKDKVEESKKKEEEEEKKKVNNEEDEDEDDEDCILKDNESIVDIDAPYTNIFCYSKSFYKDKSAKGENEFLGLWLNKLYLVTEGGFPGSQTMCEVVKRFEVTYTPVQHAVLSIREKNKDLVWLIERYATNPALSLQPFVMALNGVICASVNGGITKYKEAFLCKEYADANPADADIIAQLRREIQEQIEILYRGMDVFRARCTPDMRDLCGLLETNLEQTRTSWEKDTGVIINRGSGAGVAADADANADAAEGFEVVR